MGILVYFVGNINIIIIGIRIHIIMSETKTLLIQNPFGMNFSWYLIIDLLITLDKSGWDIDAREFFVLLFKHVIPVSENFVSIYGFLERKLYFYFYSWFLNLILYLLSKKCTRKTTMFFFFFLAVIYHK